VSGQILQRDLPSVALRDRHLRRQICHDRLGQRDLAVLHHLGQHQGREHFGNRTDLKHGVAGERTQIALFTGAVADDSSACRSQHADHNPDARRSSIR
jgi:hypothetical protein